MYLKLGEIMGMNSQILIVVDGVEKAEFDLERVNSTRFNLSVDAKEIELYRNGSEGKKFLEVFPLNFGVEENQTFKQNFKLDSGEDVKFQFVPIEDEEGTVSKINCGITFKEEKTTPVAAPVVPAAAAAAIAVPVTVVAAAENFTPPTVAPAEQTTANEELINRERSSMFLVPAVLCLILLLALSVGWFTLKGNKNDQIAKENSPDKQEKEAGKITKAPTKKEDTIKDQAVLPDDVSGGGDGDDDNEDQNLSEEKNSVSSDKNKSPADTENAVNSDKESTVQTTLPKKNTLVGSTNSVRNIGSEGRAKRDRKTNKPASKQIRRSLSAKSIRINSDKLANINNKPESSIESRRLTSKQVPAVNSEITNPTVSLASIKNTNRNRVENQNLSKVEKTSLNEGLTDKSLLEIKKVYLKWEGDIDTGILINQKVIEEIKQAGLFALMQDKANADAELRIKIRGENDGISAKNPKVKADMWLVNNFGTILTPTNQNKNTLWKYDGSLEKMPEQIVSDVNGLVAEAKQKRKSVNENTANLKKIEPTKNEFETPNIQLKPITDETIVANKNIKPVEKIDAGSSQISQNQADKVSEGKSLTEIKKVYLEWQGDIDTGVKVNQDLIETIQHSGIMNVMREKKDADGTLRINIENKSSSSAKNPKIKADMWLVNEKGKTLTPTENGKTVWKYSGKLKKMPGKVIDDIKGLVKAENEKRESNR